MRKGKGHRSFGVLVIAFLAGAGSSVFGQSRGLRTISAADMKPYLRYLASKEFRGRNAPSAELNIASRYIALAAERIGLKPLLPSGSYFQEVPVEVTTISAAKSSFRILTSGGERRFYFPQSFTANIRTGGEWAAAGDVVFVGSTPSGPEPRWVDAVEVDLRGKFALMLDVPAQAGAVPSQGAAAALARTRFLRDKGAVGLITVISPDREKNLAEKGLTFDVTERLRFPDIDNSNPLPPSPPAAAGPSGAAAQPAPFYAVELRHEPAAALLDLSRPELDRLFDEIAQGRPVAPRACPGKSVDIAVGFDQRRDSTPNVVAYLQGADSRLRDEYVVIGSHTDHVAPREGRIFPGADDNASGVVAMLEIGQAMLVERPKRSVIFVWHTAEEKGLIGAYYFVQHCPVPVEKISANLNLDMITRNDPNGIYLIGSNKLSREFDESIREMNDRTVRLKLDYAYEDPGHPDQFFFRSDQYPYIRYGIPGVWIFCGTTADYHQDTDLEERCDYAKMERVTKLVYAAAIDIGNKPGLLKLDINPEITARGKQNMKIAWRRPPQPQDKR